MKIPRWKLVAVFFLRFGITLLVAFGPFVIWLLALVAGWEVRSRIMPYFLAAWGFIGLRLVGPWVAVKVTPFKQGTDTSNNI
jgi:hypothetical protein